MKKTLLLLSAMVATLGASAQNETPETPTTITATATTTSASSDVGSDFEGHDIQVDYSKKADFGSFSIGFDQGKDKLGYFNMSIGMGFGDNSQYIAKLGYGVKKRYAISENVIVQGMLYPYLGYSSWTEKIYVPGSSSMTRAWKPNNFGSNSSSTGHTESKDKSEVTYGLSGKYRLRHPPVGHEGGQ